MLSALGFKTTNIRRKGMVSAGFEENNKTLFHSSFTVIKCSLSKKAVFFHVYTKQLYHLTLSMMQ